MLEPLAAISDVLVESRNPRAQTSEYQSQLSSLEAELTSKLEPQIHATEADSEGSIVTELYRLATLVYLWRGSASPWIRDERLDSLIDRAFHLFNELHTCDRSFLLIVLGCEARNDEERMFLLELIHRTEARHNVSNTLRMTKGLAMIWSQRDLEADEDLYFEQNYLQIMDTTISSACTLPFFS